MKNASFCLGYIMNSGKKRTLYFCIFTLIEVFLHILNQETHIRFFMQNNKETLKQELEAIKVGLLGIYLKVELPDGVTDAVKVLDYNARAQAFFHLPEAGTLYPVHTFSEVLSPEADWELLISDVCNKRTTKHIEVFHPRHNKHYGIDISHLSNNQCLINIEDITTYKKEKENLKLQEAQYQKFADDIPQIICEVNRKGELVFANNVALEAFGYTKQEVEEGVELLDFFLDKDHEEVQLYLQSILSGNKLPPREYTLNTRQGKIRVVLSTAPIFHNNKIEGIRAVITDISSQHQLNERLNILMKTGKIAWYEFDLINGMVTAGANKAEMLGYNPEEFEYVHYSKWTDNIHPDDYDATMDAMRECMFERSTNIYEVDYRIKKDDGTYGWFYDRGVINDYAGDGRPSRMIGVVVDITDRKLQEIKLKENENKYRQLVENANDVILITQHGKIIFANNQIQTFFGYNKDEIIGKDFIDFLPPKEKKQVLEIHQKRLEGIEVPMIYETKIINANNSISEVELNNAMIEMGGQPAVLTFVRDLTERKKTSRKLRQLHMDYEQAVKNAKSILWKSEYTDNKFTNTFISDVGEELLGLPEGYLNNSLANFLTLIDNRDKDNVLEKINQSLENPGEKVEFEYRIQNPKGNLIWLVTQSNTKITSENKKVIYGITLDISDRKQYEIELNRQQAFLQKIYDTIPSTLGVKDQEGRYINVNRKFSEFVGLPVDDIIGKTDFDILDDQDEAIEHDEEDKQILESGDAVSSIRAHRIGNKTVYMEYTKVPFRNKNSESAQLLFISHDVTQQIQDHNAAKRKSRELMLLSENTDLQIWYLKNPDTYGLINKSHAKFLDRKKEEIEYQNFRNLFSKEFAEKYIASNRQCFDQKKRHRFQQWNLDGKGIPRLLDITKTPMVDSSGNVEFVVCTARDITKEKEAEDKLITALEFNETLIENSPMGIIVYEPSGQCILTNEAAVTTIGAKEKSDVLSQNIHNIQSWKETGLYDAFIACNKTDQKQHKKVNIITTFNKDTWLDCNFIPVRYKERKHIMLILNDISNTVEYEQSIQKNLSQQKLLSTVAFELNELKHFDTNMKNALSQIGQYANVSRTYIFLDTADGTRTSNVFEWCNEGISTEIDNLQNISYADDLHPWKEMLIQDGLIHTDDTDKLSSVIKKTVKPQGIKSLLVLPLYFFGEYKGFIGFDENTQNKYWSEEEVELLRTVRHIIANTYERKIIGDNLRESEEKFKKISTNAQDGIILIDHQGIVTYWNHAAEEIFGYKETEILGKNLHKITTSRVHHEQFLRNMPEFAKTGKGNAIGKNIELQAYHKRGKKIDIELSLSSLKIKGRWNALGIVRDVTKRKKAETELRTLSKAVENASAIIVITDPDATIQYVNKKFTDITGYLPEEVIGKNPSILSTKLLPDEFYQDLWSTLQSGKEWKGEFINKKKNGEHYYESALISSITDKNGDILHYIGIKNDITQEKNAREELIKAKQEAEAANNAKSEFLANMSHEIRTPMNAIIGFSELLAKDLSNERHRKFIQSIQNSSKTLLNLINDILDLSKIEAGQIHLQPESTNLKKLAEEITQVFSLKIQEKGLELIQDIDPEIPEHIIIDEMRTRQILLNIMGNAVKFTEEGYVKLILEKTHTHEDNSIDIVCHIEDSGIGISRENQEEIFESFKQQSKQDNRKYGGTGLGLAISRRLINIMGGSISLQSVPGNGSTFSIFFKKVNLPEINIQTEEKNKAKEQSDYLFNGETILIVDDVLSNRYLLTSYIEEFNLEIIQAENGQEAINKTRKHRPSLILMDLRMPVMDGIDATLAIKSGDDSKNIPVIAVTATSMQYQKSEIDRARFDDFLEKPVSPEQIIGILVKYLKPKTKQSGQQNTKAQKEEQKVSKEIQNLFLNKFSPKMAVAEASGNMQQIKDFGKEVLDFGKSHKSDYYQQEGSNLIKAADNFDIEQINKIFRELI